MIAIKYSWVVAPFRKLLRLLSECMKIDQHSEVFQEGYTHILKKKGKKSYRAKFCGHITLLNCLGKVLKNSSEKASSFDAGKHFIMPV